MPEATTARIVGRSIVKGVVTGLTEPKAAATAITFDS
jgi:hypothetical protein